MAGRERSSRSLFFDHRLHLPASRRKELVQSLDPAVFSRRRGYDVFVIVFMAQANLLFPGRCARYAADYQVQFKSFERFHVALFSAPVPLHLSSEFGGEILDQFGFDAGSVVSVFHSPGRILNHSDPNAAAASILEGTVWVARKIRLRWMKGRHKSRNDQQ